MDDEHTWLRVPLAHAELVTNDGPAREPVWFLAVEDHQGTRLHWWSTEALAGDRPACRDLLDAVVAVGHPIRVHDDDHGLEDLLVLGGAELRVDPDRDRLSVAFSDGATAGGCSWTVEELAADPGAVLARTVGMLAALTGSGRS